MASARSTRKLAAWEERGRMCSIGSSGVGRGLDKFDQEGHEKKRRMGK